MNNQIITDQNQLELGFNGIKATAVARRERPRITRSRWWFEQMRQAVDRAMDWEPNHPGRPEQMRLADASGKSHN